MSSVILLVRSRQELTDEVFAQLWGRFGAIEFIDVEPRTPEELDEMVTEHDAVAVFLRENPLPVKAMERVPCVVNRPGRPLQQLISIEPELRPL